MKKKFIDLTGYTINGFLVVSLNSIVKQGIQSRTYWNCKCKCGNIAKLRADALKRILGCNCSRKRWIDTPLTVNGISKLPKEWARYYGITPKHIYDRIRYGMPTEMAITTPIGKPGVTIR